MDSDSRPTPAEPNFPGLNPSSHSRRPLPVDDSANRFGSEQLTPEERLVRRFSSLPPVAVEFRHDVLAAASQAILDRRAFRQKLTALAAVVCISVLSIWRIATVEKPSPQGDTSLGIGLPDFPATAPAPNRTTNDSSRPGVEVKSTQFTQPAAAGNSGQQSDATNDPSRSGTKKPNEKPRPADQNKKVNQPSSASELMQSPILGLIQGDSREIEEALHNRGALVRRVFCAM